MCKVLEEHLMRDEKSNACGFKIQQIVQMLSAKEQQCVAINHNG